MNTWELISYWRNLPKFDSENKISTPELLRLLNLGYGFVGQALYPLFSDDLVVELDAGSFNSAQTLYAPDDALYIISVYRETGNGTNLFKKCTRVDVEKKDLIGNDPQYPSRADYPYFVHEGKQIRVYPAFLASPSDIAVKIVYRKRLADLIMGSSTTVGVADTLTLDVLASIRNDIYNGYDFAIYRKNSSADNAWELNKILKVSDYVGSTKLMSFRDTSGNDEFSAATEYRYAIYPYIPEEYHNLIIDATRIELVKAGRIEGDARVMEAALAARMAAVLQVQLGKTEGRQD